MLEFKNVSFAYPNGRTVLNNLSFSLKKGSSVGILGDSGSGKSTVAKLACKLYLPTQGTISTNGTIQMIFQNPTGSLNPRWTISQILEEPLKLHKIKKSLKEILEEVGLSEDFLSRRPSQLSGGQCQRVAVARALSLSPDILIADESTSSLDRHTERQVLNLLKTRQQAEGFALIVISHNPEVIRYMTDETICISNNPQFYISANFGSSHK